MTTRHVLLAAVCSTALMLPEALTAQTDTTRRDTTRMRDTTMMRRDTTGMMGRDTTGMMRNMQDTTRRTTTGTPPRATSQQRLRVQKGEAGGTLTDTRADSIAAAERARQDSVNAAMQRQQDSLAAIERQRADSIAAIERVRADSIARVEAFRRDSIARADSITAAEEARRREMARYRFGGTGWYVGVGAGASAPVSEFQNIGYNSGLNVHVPIGWHRDNSLLGVRFDVNYNRFSGRTFTGNVPSGAAGSATILQNGNPSVFSATANVTIATPLTLLRNVRLYGVGGGGLYHFRSFGPTSALGGFLGNDVLNTNEPNNKETRNKLGANVGAGLDWTVGTSSVYLESRWVSVFADRDDDVAFRDFFGSNRSSTLNWVPIVLGVKIR